MPQPKISESELEFSFARSGGPGGQNVNKLNTKAVARWNYLHSSILSDAEKMRLQQKLANRISKEGNIIVAVDSERSQLQNKNRATEILHALVARALSVPKKRRATRPTRASKERRLQSKTKHSQLKNSRQKRNIS